MIAVGGVNELRGDADSSARAPHAAFENGANVQSFGDLADVLLFSAENKRGGAGGDFQAEDIASGR